MAHTSRRSKTQEAALVSFSFLTEKRDHRVKKRQEDNFLEGTFYCSKVSMQSQRL